MMRLALAFVLTISLSAQAFAQADSDPLNSLPGVVPNASSYSATREFLRDEDADRQNEIFGQQFVDRNCIHGTAAGMVGSFTATPCVAYPGGYRISESAASINYAAVGADVDDVCWVIANSSATGALNNFARVTGTHYAVDCINTSQPTLPTSSTWLMEVTFASGAISAVQDLRVMALSGGGTDIPFLGVCDGVTDDAPAFAAALASAAAAGGRGTIVLPPKTCAVASTIQWVRDVSLRGHGGYLGSRILALTDNQATVINVPTSAGVHFEDVFIDGGDKALVGLYLELNVQNHFENLWVQNAKRAGIYVSGGQNNTFVSVHPEHNGSATGQLCTAYDETTFECGAGWVWDNGAANNDRYNCEISNNTPWQEIYWDDEEVTLAGASTQGPTNNSCDGCQIERPAWSCSNSPVTECVSNTDCGAGTCTLQGAGLVYHRTGIHNTYTKTNFATNTAGGSPTATGMIGVLLTNEENDKGCTTCLAGQAKFTKGFFSTGGTDTIAFEFRDSFLDYIDMPINLNSTGTAFAPDDGTLAEVGNRTVISGTGTDCTPTEAAPCENLIRESNALFPDRSESYRKAVRALSNDEILQAFVLADNVCAGGTNELHLCTSNADCAGGGICEGSGRARRIDYASGLLSFGSGGHTCGCPSATNCTTANLGTKCSTNSDCTGGSLCSAQDTTIARNELPSGWPVMRLNVPLAVMGSCAADYAGNGSPEGVVTACKSSEYKRLDGAGCTVKYFKASGDNTNTGWQTICGLAGIGSSFSIGTYCLSADATSIYVDRDCSDSKDGNERYIDAPEWTCLDLNPSTFDGISVDYDSFVPAAADITTDIIQILINTGPWYMRDCADIDDIDDWGLFCVSGATNQDVHFGDIIPANAAGQVCFRKTYE